VAAAFTLVITLMSFTYIKQYKYLENLIQNRRISIFAKIRKIETSEAINVSLWNKRKSCEHNKTTLNKLHFKANATKVMHLKNKCISTQLVTLY